MPLVLLNPQEHRLLPQLSGLHHPLQHLLQRRQAFQGNPRRDGKQVRGRLFPPALPPSRRSQGRADSAPALGEFRPLDRESPEGHPAPKHQEKAREEVRQRLGPEIQGMDEARGVQPLPPQRLDDDGPKPVLQRRLRWSGLYLLLHLAPFRMAPGHCGRSPAHAGHELPRARMAL